MNELLPLALALQFSLGASSARPPAGAVAPREIPPSAAVDTVSTADRWFAEDKLQHFFLSFAATSMAYGAARTVGMEGAPAQIAAVAVAGAAGIWKEWRDHRVGGPFSAKDLAWDALGIGAGVVLTSQTR